MRLALTLLAAVVVALGFAEAVHSESSDDQHVCNDAQSDDQIRIAACTRQIASNRLRGRDLAIAHTNRGYARLAKRDFDGAILDYTEAIRLDPQDSEPYNGRGSARKIKGDIVGAIADYGEAIRLAPQLPGAYSNRGGVRSGKGDFDGAIADYGEAIRIDRQLGHSDQDAVSQLAITYTERGDTRLKKDDVDGAIADYNEAIRVDPQHADGYRSKISNYLTNRANDHANKSELDGAIADYSQVIKLQPNSTNIFERGDLYLRAGDFDRAIADFTEVIRIDPRSERTMGIIRGSPFNNAYYYRGFAFQAEGMLDQATSDFDQAIQMYGKWITSATETSNDPLTRMSAIYALQFRATAYDAKGDEGPAIADYTEALRISGSADLYVSRGNAYWHNSDLGHAISDYSEAIRLSSQINDDTNVDRKNAALSTAANAYSSRGAAYGNRGDWTRAVSDFDEAIKLAAQVRSVGAPIISANAYNARGVAYRNQRDWKHAISDFDKAIRIRPSFAAAFVGRASVYNDEGDYDHAISDLNEAIRLSPSASEALVVRGKTYFDKGDYDHALADLNKAIQLAPKNAEALTLRGIVFENENELDSARSDFAAALALPEREYREDKLAHETSRIALAKLGQQPNHRVALVIGNSAYVNVPRLTNPANDARLMADTLRSLGFTLVGGGPLLDLDEDKLRRAVQDFGSQLQAANVGVFYYAGHGVQVRGANYLVPVDANPTREADTDFQMIDGNLVLRQMESAGTKLNIVILDACRNNPFGGRGLRATGGGLAQMEAPEGTLISFATQPGNVALEGKDGHSPYTAALAQVMRKPGLDVFRTFNEVGLAVASSTAGEQKPWFSSSPIKGDFYFAGAPASMTNTDH